MNRLLWDMRTCWTWLRLASTAQARNTLVKGPWGAPLALTPLTWWERNAAIVDFARHWLMASLGFGGVWLLARSVGVRRRTRAKARALVVGGLSSAAASPEGPRGWSRPVVSSVVLGLAIAISMAFARHWVREARWEGSCVIDSDLVGPWTRMAVLDMVGNPPAGGTKVSTYGTVDQSERARGGAASVYSLKGDEGGVIEVQTNAATLPIPGTRYDNLQGIVQFKLGADGSPTPYLLEARSR